MLSVKRHFQRHIIINLVSFSVIYLFVCFPTQTFQLQLQSPSGNVVPPNNSGAINQEVKVANPQQVNLSNVCLFNVLETRGGGLPYKKGRGGLDVPFLG